MRKLHLDTSGGAFCSDSTALAAMCKSGPSRIAVMYSCWLPELWWEGLLTFSLPLQRTPQHAELNCCEVQCVLFDRAFNPRAVPDLLTQLNVKNPNCNQLKLANHSSQRAKWYSDMLGKDLTVCFHCVDSPAGSRRLTCLTDLSSCKALIDRIT